MTYGTLMTDGSIKGRRVLQQLSWFRVILDEGKYAVHFTR